MLAAVDARADVFDTTLASPDTTGATGNASTGANNGNNPSWYNGAGNPQGGWTTSTTNGVEVGLRAKYRNVDSVIDTLTDDYSVMSGECILDPTCKGSSSNANLALWNYEFSIDLRPGGVGSLTLANIVATLTVTDVTTGATGTVNPLTHWVDDSGFGSGAGGASGLTSTGKHIPEVPADWGAQNSENLGFADSPLAGVFNPNANDEYDFVLTVSSPTGAVLATTDIEVQATPEPSAVILLATAAIGLFVLAHRRAAA
jgi:hypothetical protein